MKSRYLVVFVGLLTLIPAIAFAVSDSANGQNSATSNSSTGGNQSQNETSVQTQTNNSGTSTSIQTQTEAKIQEQLNQTKSNYTPVNGSSLSKMNALMTVAEQLIRTAAQIENSGTGSQIRSNIQTQIKNDEQICISIDKAEQRSKFAKFFIGPNYRELKSSENFIAENQIKIKELERVMAQVTNSADKIAIANQIILLQNIQLELKDQIDQLSNGFSLFGWINRWYNNY